MVQYQFYIIRLNIFWFTLLLIGSFQGYAQESVTERNSQKMDLIISNRGVLDSAQFDYLKQLVKDISESDRLDLYRKFTLDSTFLSSVSTNDRNGYVSRLLSPPYALFPKYTNQYYWQTGLLVLGLTGTGILLSFDRPNVDNNGKMNVALMISGLVAFVGGFSGAIIIGNHLADEQNKKLDELLSW